MHVGETAAAAVNLITGDRAKQYGPPDVDFQRTVDVFNRLTGRDLTIKDGIMFMMCVKLSRAMNLDQPDNMVDLCGYADIYNAIAFKETQTW